MNKKDIVYTIAHHAASLVMSSAPEILTEVVKHYGPGDHPGTGTPQEAHGGQTVYHGTVDTFADDIQANGLLLSKASAVSKKGKIYVTTDLESAKYWGEDKADYLGLDKTKVKLVVFEIRIPEGVTLSRDVQSHGKNDFVHAGNIPPEWIVGYTVHDFFSKKSASEKYLVPVLYLDGKYYL